jgi:sulfoxide reductase heme-binding subunit YedZ
MARLYFSKLKPAHLPWLKFIIHLSALVPLLLTFFQAFNDELGGDPVSALLHFTGLGAFKLLLLSLLVTPLARLLKQSLFMNVRRLLGLYSFTYALAHIASYVLFDLQLDWPLLVSEIVKRPYITLGFVGWLILFALALTSTRQARRRLGKHWQGLHNWVYLAAILVSIHFLWSVKSAILEPTIYMVITALLLVYRRDKLERWFKKRIKIRRNIKK